MVCLGNICRSPLAEGIMASKLPKDKFNVDSAGTGSWHIGHSPDARSISTAKKKIVDISKQKEDNSIVMILNYDYICHGQI
jgi:protein-tyrosine phosphatase